MSGSGYFLVIINFGHVYTLDLFFNIVNELMFFKNSNISTLSITVHYVCMYVQHCVYRAFKLKVKKKKKKEKFKLSLLWRSALTQTEVDIWSPPTS